MFNVSGWKYIQRCKGQRAFRAKETSITLARGRRVRNFTMATPPWLLEQIVNLGPERLEGFGSQGVSKTVRFLGNSLTCSWLAGFLESLLGQVDSEPAQRHGFNVAFRRRIGFGYTKGLPSSSMWAKRCVAFAA